MRLTLRTLLAWLDDTLPPIQVREIGRQVSESPYAQELVERIHRVTRQRRLTVPGKSGPEGTDPNIVAGYVDNDLDAEQVGEYEKKCLSSDVNLAEAACVHQILSLLGQKVHVPVEAKARMYQLVKGRESTPVARGDGVKPAVRAPVTEPIQPWVAPPPPARHWLERFGPVAGCLALVALLMLVGLSEPDTTAGPNAVLRGSSATPARSRPGRRGLRRASRDESPRWELAARGRGSHRRDSRRRRFQRRDCRRERGRARGDHGLGQQHRRSRRTTPASPRMSQGRPRRPVPFRPARSASLIKSMASCFASTPRSENGNGSPRERR